MGQAQPRGWSEFLLEAQNAAGVEMVDEDGEVSSDDIPLKKQSFLQSCQVNS